MKLLQFSEIEQYVCSQSLEDLVVTACKKELVLSGVEESVFDCMGFPMLMRLLEEKTRDTYAGSVGTRIQEEIADIQENFERYRQLYGQLADAKSRTTLCCLMAFRLSRDDRYLAEAYSASGEQYFEEGVMALPENGVYVDCGAFDGDTAAAYAFHARKNTGMYLFEPMEECVEKCRGLFTSEKNVHIYQAAVSDKAELVKMLAAVPGSSRLSQEGEVAVHSVVLDTEITEKIGFLKMDIEGSEAAALAGCKKHIAEESPVMAVCVYHRPNDLYEIAAQILSYNESYDLYLRHYTFWADETVLYAIPRRKDLTPLQNGSGEIGGRLLKKYIEGLRHQLVQQREARQFLMIQYRGFQEIARKSEEERKCHGEAMNALQEQFRKKDRQAAELIEWADKLTEAREFYSRQCEEKDRQIAELKQWTEKLVEAREYYSQQCEKKDQQLAEMKLWADNLSEAKEFFEAQYKAKDAQTAELIEWADKLTEARDYFQQQCSTRDDWIAKLQEKERRHENQVAELENTIAKQHYKLNLLLNDEKIRKIIQKKHYEI